MALSPEKVRNVYLVHHFLGLHGQRRIASCGYMMHSREAKELVSRVHLVYTTSGLWKLIHSQMILSHFISLKALQQTVVGIIFPESVSASSTARYRG